MRTYRDLSEKTLKKLHFEYNPAGEQDAMLNTRVVTKNSYIQVEQYVGSQIRNSSTFYFQSGRINFSWENGNYDATDELLAQLRREYKLYGYESAL